MRVATWNVNGLRARIEFVLAWMHERQPDVVGLQEIKLTDDIFPHDAFAEIGYRAVSHGQKSWNGVAILARETPEVTCQGLPGQEAFGARLLTARVGKLDFTTVYVPNGKRLEHDDFPRKLTWLETLASFLESRSGTARPAIVAGDFNVCPTGLDSWNEAKYSGEIFHTREARERIGALGRAGYVDLWRELHPDLQAFSWWDYRGGAFHRKRGLRIDFLLGNAAARSSLRAAEIDRDWRRKRDDLTPSDHAPAWVDLA